MHADTAVRSLQRPDHVFPGPSQDGVRVPQRHAFRAGNVRSLVHPLQVIAVGRTRRKFDGDIDIRDLIRAGKQAAEQGHPCDAEHVMRVGVHFLHPLEKRLQALRGVCTLDRVPERCEGELIAGRRQRVPPLHDGQRLQAAVGHGQTDELARGWDRDAKACCRGLGVEPAPVVFSE